MVNGFVNRSWTFRATTGNALPQALRLRRREPVQPRWALVTFARRGSVCHRSRCGSAHGQVVAANHSAAHWASRRAPSAPGEMTRAAVGARRIVNADDFGLSEAESRRDRAHENGIVTSTSIMAGGSVRARGARGTLSDGDVGVHLTLTELRRSPNGCRASSADGQFAPRADFAKRRLSGGSLGDARKEPRRADPARPRARRAPDASTAISTCTCARNCARRSRNRARARHRRGAIFRPHCSGSQASNVSPSRSARHARRTRAQAPTLRRSLVGFTSAAA